MEKYEITPEHRIELEKIKQKYIDNSRRTDAMNAHDKEQMRVAMHGLYKNADVDYPGDDRILFVSSPLVAQFAAGIAMAFIKDKDTIDTASLVGAVTIAEKAAQSAAKKVGINNISLDVYLREIIGVTEKYGEYALHSVNYAWRYRSRSAYYPWHQVYGDFFKNVAKIPGEWEKWDPINLDCLHGGVRFMTPDFTIIADRPELLKMDDDVLHSEVGPAVKWRDGLEQYYWRGMSVPDTWIKNKESITPEIALKWENIEQRRCAQEIYGLDKLLEHQDVQTKLIDKNNDPMIGSLYSVILDTHIGEEMFLKVKCGTGRTFVMRTEVKYKTALEANASLGGWREDFDTPPENFIPFIRT